ncbi:MAG: 3-dehydroquinate synthase [Alphaproteobacteria bacterium GM202ARS2]|nr:3-dehydroquinate synthase [Alphaproteobacteria bacterium GM202ARS2]
MPDSSAPQPIWLDFKDKHRCGILVGSGFLDRLPVLIETHGAGVLTPERKVLLLYDSAVETHYGARIDTALRAYNVIKHVVPAGEGSKSFSALEALCTRALSAGIDRKTLVIAVGGGVIGDLGGFAASILLRGLPLVHVPTTLLAHVDSAIGGKTAINAASGKNLIGTFYQPHLVIADSATLASLPRRQMIAGYGEVLKYACINDPPFFQWLQHNGKSLLNEPNSDATRYAVAHCARKKADIVLQDETEHGVRALLNLGHSFAHALESAYGYSDTLLHGEAVIIGIVLAARLSRQLGIAQDPQLEKTLTDHLASLDLLPPVAIDTSALRVDDLMATMARDKKNVGAHFNVIALRAIGDAFIYKNCPPEALRAVWTRFLASNGSLS